jgi:hypothetical protein
MLVDNANSIDETFKILGLSKKEIEEAKQMHKTALEIDKKLGGDGDKKIYVNRRRKVNRTKKIKGGSDMRMALTFSGHIVSFFYLSHIGFLYRAAFGLAWPKIVDVLDNYIDGKILDDTILTQICNLIAYLLPFKLLDYFMKVAVNDANVIAKDLAKELAKTKESLAVAQTMAFSSNPDFTQNPYFNSYFDPSNMISKTPIRKLGQSVNLTLNDATSAAASGASNGVALGSLVTDVKGMFMHLYNLAKTSVISHPYMATGIVLSLPIIAFMGYYLKIRVSGSKDKNLDLDKTIYMNHKRRILIMKAQLRKATKKENEIRREEKEYDLKLQQQMEEGKKEEHVEESKKRKRQWHKFVKRGFDENELYQQNDFLTDSKRSTRRKKSNDKDDDKSFLAREEQNAKDENKSLPV